MFGKPVTVKPQRSFAMRAQHIPCIPTGRATIAQTFVAYKLSNIAAGGTLDRVTRDTKAFAPVDYLIARFANVHKKSQPAKE